MSQKKIAELRMNRLHIYNLPREQAKILLKAQLIIEESVEYKNLTGNIVLEQPHVLRENSIDVKNLIQLDILKKVKMLLIIYVPEWNDYEFRYRFIISYFHELLTPKILISQKNQEVPRRNKISHKERNLKQLHRLLFRVFPEQKLELLST